MANTNFSKEKGSIEWLETSPEDYRKWCHAGGRRYIFVDCVIENDRGYRGMIHEVDLDSFDKSDCRLDEESREYIESQETDYNKAYAIADCMDDCRETELYATEEELWQRVMEMEV